MAGNGKPKVQPNAQGNQPAQKPAPSGFSAWLSRELTPRPIGQIEQTLNTGKAPQQGSFSRAAASPQGNPTPDEAKKKSSFSRLMSAMGR